MIEINYIELLSKLDECKTKSELISVLREYGIRSTTKLSDKETKNDFYFQFADKSRIQIMKNSIKLLTNSTVSRKQHFEYLKFKEVKNDWDGSYRNKYTTVSKTPENLKLILEYFLEDKNNLVV